MKLKKIALALAAVLCLSVLAGCSGKTGLERGSVDAGVYKSSSLAVSFTAPADWSFMSDDEMQSYYGSVSEEIPNGEDLSKAEVVYDMLAYSADGITTVGINFENLGKLYGTVLDEDSYIEIAKEKLIEQFDQMGYTAVIDETSSLNVGGSEFRCISLTISMEGLDVNIYEELLVKKVDSWMGIITVSALSEEEVSQLVSCLGGI